MEVLEAPADAVGDVIDALVGVQRMMASLAAIEVQLLDLGVLSADSDADRSGANRDLAYRSFRAELATSLTLTEGAVDRRLATAYSLTRGLPSTLAALRDGRISYRHAEVMARETIGLDDQERRDVEDSALPHAQNLTVPKFERRVRTIRERRAPECAPERHRAALTERTVTMTAAADGMAWLNAHLPAVEAVSIFGRLDTLARSVRHTGDPRGVAQLRADILCDALLDEATGGLDATARGRDASAGGLDTTASALGDRLRRIRPTVVVTVPVSTLAGGTDPAELEGIGPIDSELARRLASWAPFFRRMLTDPVTGISRDFDRTRYRPSKDLRLWLRLRDRTCGFIGCNRPAAACDLDHTNDWAHLGPTKDDNLAHLCRSHHTLKHSTSWQVTQAPDGSGRLRWTSPRGRVYFREPEAPP